MPVPVLDLTTSLRGDINGNGKVLLREAEAIAAHKGIQGGPYSIQNCPDHFEVCSMRKAFFQQNVCWGRFYSPTLS